MANTARMTKEEKIELLSENTQWRTTVEQVVLLLGARKDPQAAQITVWLMRWLSDPKNVRRTRSMSVQQIIDLAKSMLV
jgi:hypothetical protein